MVYESTKNLLFPGIVLPQWTVWNILPVAWLNCFPITDAQKQHSRSWIKSSLCTCPFATSRTKMYYLRTGTVIFALNPHAAAPMIISLALWPGLRQEMEIEGCCNFAEWEMHSQTRDLFLNGIQSSPIKYGRLFVCECSSALAASSTIKHASLCFYGLLIYCARSWNLHFRSRA